MFKNEADFEKTVGRLDIDNKPNPAHRESLRREMLSTFDETSQKSQEQTTPHGVLRRIIMRNPVTKTAAAAVMIIATLIGIHYLDGSIDGTSVAWAEVLEQISSHTKYKCRQRVVRGQGPESPTKQVYHLNLQQRRQELEDGSIHIIDMRGEDAMTVQLDPTQNKAIVTRLLGSGPMKDPNIIEMIKQFERESGERLGTREKNGKTLHGFKHKQRAQNEFTAWVDAETKLPVEIEIRHLDRGQTIFLDEFEFDFDLDPSAFSTEVPDGYEVKNLTLYYGPFEPREISAQDIRAGLNHAAYTVGRLPWVEKIVMAETLSPLGTRNKVYLTGIRTDDGNTIIVIQGNLYDLERMVWIPNEQLVLTSPGGAELYTHPNGSIYAKCFLESLAEACPEFFTTENLSEERFTRMIVMPNETILGLAVNQQMSEEKLQELVESLTKIRTN
jgi:outer membrane lipoprotein-sorting protein